MPHLTDDMWRFCRRAAWPVGGPITSPPNDTDHSVSSMAGGKTADVFSANLLPGTVGTYQIVLHLNSDIPTIRPCP